MNVLLKKKSCLSTDSSWMN